MPRTSVRIQAIGASGKSAIDDQSKSQSRYGIARSNRKKTGTRKRHRSSSTTSRIGCDRIVRIIGAAADTRTARPGA